MGRANNIVLKRGNACIYLCNSNGNICRCIVKNALYIPTFKQNIFSVQVTTKNCAHISFERTNCQLIYPNEAVFNITQRGRFHYLKNVSAKNTNYVLHTWHKILGHGNESDIKKLPNLVKEMKIKPIPNYTLKCDICIHRKMSNDRNKTLERKATKILALVHSELAAGHIQPLAKEGYKYVLKFIDDYFDTLLATSKYLDNIAPYGHVKCLQTNNETEFNSEPFQWLFVLNRIKYEQTGLYSLNQGEPYFPWKDVSLLSQNCPKTCGFTH